MKIQSYLRLGLAFACLALGVTVANAQAKKPTLMVVPSTTWCNNNGYVTTVTNQGKTTNVPDYERALNENADLMNVITKIGELMADRDFPLKDLSSAINTINRGQAEDEMLVSRESGASLAQTAYERLKNVAKADIILELLWTVNKNGPKQSVTYNLRGIDAYSNKQIAASSGTGPSSFSAELPVLLEEAVISNMDQFTSQLQAHFDDMVENGREVVVNIRVFDNGSGLSLEDEYGGEELTDIIDSWMNDNTVNHRYSLSDASDYTMRFEQVRIPLYRTNGAPMDTRAFVNNLRKFLSASPYNITSKLTSTSLGRADLILGEK